MFLKDEPDQEPTYPVTEVLDFLHTEPTPPIHHYDEWMAEEEGLEPPTDTPIESNPRSEECAEYYRSVS